MRSAGEVERNAVSIERMLHYTDTPPEAPYENQVPTPEHWPSKGGVDIQLVACASAQCEYSDTDTAIRHMCAKYRPDLDLALEDITLKIVGDLHTTLQHSVL